MKNCLLFISCALFVLLFPFCIPEKAYAHITEKNGTIGGVIHIDPEDDPVVGQQSTILIELSDATAELTRDTCNCTFQISSEGKTLYEQPLFQGASQPDIRSILIPFTFPRRDVYTLKVHGAPSNGGKFQEFSLVYEVRVAKETSDKTALRKNVSFLSSNLPYIVGTGIVILFLVGALLRKRLSQ